MSKKPAPQAPRPHALNHESWSIFQIISEFVEGFEQLSSVVPSVSVFGSARTPVDHPDYAFTETVCRKLSDRGFTVVTGGGPGIMEAGNKGAQAGKSHSVGLNIVLPREQVPNAYQDLSLHYRHFFSRKVMFLKYACAHVVMPGGFGTMDELMEILTLVQTGKVRRVPIILVRGAFWQGLIDWFRDTLAERGTIKVEDLDLLKIVETPDEVIEIIREFDETHGLEATARDMEIMRGL
ncbi:MAG: TIGR00730 family Rossman fold protein [Pseudomonadota bacterium]